MKMIFVFMRRCTPKAYHVYDDEANGNEEDEKEKDRYNHGSEEPHLLIYLVAC